MDVFSSRNEHYYELVKEYFSKEDFIEIINGFSEYEDSNRTFIPYDVFDVIKIIKSMKFDNPLFDGLHLVLITSIIELLITWVDYVPFFKWYKENEEKYKNKKCVRAWNDYITMYGKTKQFKEFFIDFEKDEKFKLLHLIQKMYKENESYRPLCYQGAECDYSKFVCNYDALKNKCPAIKDDKILNNGIKNFAEHLYNFRSLFVHEARLPRFASVPPSYLDKQREEHIHLKSMTMYTLKEKDEYVKYHSELLVEDFFTLMMRKTVKMMKKYLINVKKIDAVRRNL